MRQSCWRRSTVCPRGRRPIVAAIPQAQQVRVRDKARCKGDNVLRLESDVVVESAKRDLRGLFVDGQIDYAFTAAVAAVGIIQRGGGVQGGKELGTDCFVDVVPLEDGIPRILIVGIVQENGKDIFRRVLIEVRSHGGIGNGHCLIRARGIQFLCR